MTRRSLNTIQFWLKVGFFSVPAVAYTLAGYVRFETGYFPHAPIETRSYITLVVLVALTVFLKRTRYGLEMRAAADNFTMARMLGVRANRVILLAFAISGMLAAAIGLILATNSGTADIGMGANLMLIAFIATVIGGLGSVPGAVAAGFLIGGASVVFQATLPHDARVFRDAFVYGAVIVVLLVRPQGLFAPKSAKQRV